jgi:hypothetical protein
VESDIEELQRKLDEAYAEIHKLKALARRDMEVGERFKVMFGHGDGLSMADKLGAALDQLAQLNMMVARREGK